MPGNKQGIESSLLLLLISALSSSNCIKEDFQFFLDQMLIFFLNKKLFDFIISVIFDYLFNIWHLFQWHIIFLDFYLLFIFLLKRKSSILRNWFIFCFIKFVNKYLWVMIILFICKMSASWRNLRFLKASNFQFLFIT